MKPSYGSCQANQEQRIMNKKSLCVVCGIRYGYDVIGHCHLQSCGTQTQQKCYLAKGVVQKLLCGKRSLDILQFFRLIYRKLENSI